MDNSPARAAAPSTPRSHQLSESYGEIDLVELGEGLWKQRVLILGITAATMFLGLVYVFAASPEYLAEARLRPPTSADLELLSARSAPFLATEGTAPAEAHVLYQAEPARIFNEIVATAQSAAARRKAFEALAPGFLETSISAEERARALSRFLAAYAVSQQGDVQGAAGAGVTLQVAFRDPDPAFAAAAANTLLQVTNDVVSLDVVDEYRTAMKSRIKSLQAELDRRINAVRISTERTITRLLEDDSVKRAQLQDELTAELRKTAQERADRITALRSALASARSLGIEQPTSLETLAARSLPGETSFINLEDRNEDLLFLRGTVMLEAELTELEAREDDRPYTARAREIEKQLQLLENNRTVEYLRKRTDFAAYAPQAAEIEAEIEKLESFLERDFSGLRIARVDQIASPPSQPVAPRKRIILAVAVLLGLMLGVFVALVRNAVLNRRESGPD